MTCKTPHFEVAYVSNSVYTYVGTVLLTTQLILFVADIIDQWYMVNNILFDGFSKNIIFTHFNSLIIKKM